MIAQTLLATLLSLAAPHSLHTTNAKGLDCISNPEEVIEQQLETISIGMDVYRDVALNEREPDQEERILLNAAFALLNDRNRPVSQTDVDILDRALEIFVEENWDREDDRNCSNDEAGSLSIFCALQQASVDILGTYVHRRTALQEVRFIIGTRSEGRDYAHRLMDYNNDPRTSFADARSALSEAKAIVEQRLSEQSDCVE